MDAYGIMIMLSDPVDTQQLGQDSLILLFDLTSDCTEIHKEVCPEVLVSDSGKVGKKTVKFPKTTVSLNHLFNQTTHF